MKKGFFVFVVILGFSFQVLAQFTPEELAEREKWEEFLKAAKIIDQVQQKGARAVTEPWELSMEKDGITKRALWKNPEGRQKGFLEGWKWEIAAYRLDKYLGLNMVPPTVEKRFQGDRGSCQLWIDAWIDMEQKATQKIKSPSTKVFFYNRALYLQRAFDNLISNVDRHQRNYLIMKDWRIILIDHSRSFRTSRKYTKNLIYDEKNKENPNFLMRQLPKTFVEKLKDLNIDLVKEIVGEYLTEKEIKAMLKRRDLILDWLDKRIKKFGEKEVLYQP